MTGTPATAPTTLREYLVAWPGLASRLGTEQNGILISRFWAEVDADGNELDGGSLADDVESFEMGDVPDDSEGEVQADAALAEHGYRRVSDWGYYGDGINAEVEVID